jgi:hypothetical protein
MDCDMYSFYKIPDSDKFHCVHNAKVYGLFDSIRRAKFPMAVDISGIINPEEMAYWTKDNFLERFVKHQETGQYPIYEVNDDCVVVRVKKENGEDATTLVDEEDLPAMFELGWNFDTYSRQDDVKAQHNSLRLKDAILAYKNARRLAKTKQGAGEDQWLTGVIVQFDLTFSNKTFVEAERYHFLDFVSSQSTMHRIAKFNLESQYNSYVDKKIISIMKEKVDEYNKMCAPVSIGAESVKQFEEKKRELYLEILYSNPAGFELTAGMTTNYRQLKTIYHQRKNHRLPEWREFCKWIETLPMSYLITGENGNDKGC